MKRSAMYSGSKNPNARKGYINNKYYESMGDACVDLNISMYKARKLWKDI